MLFFFLFFFYSDELLEVEYNITQDNTLHTKGL